MENPIHPPLPLGIGSYVTLTGIAGAIAAFVIAWVQEGLTSNTVALGLGAVFAIATWFAGRSHQAAKLIMVAQAIGDEVGVSVKQPAAKK